MNILWLAWKDYTHPARGGAEIVLREIMQRQRAEGHTVTLLTARHPGSSKHDTLDGIRVIRVGNNRYTHPIMALGYYLRHLHGKFDMIIETVNTAPYFALLFRGKARAFAMYHQLAREIWFLEAKAPFSHLGYYLIEPLATWLLGRTRTPLITVSESTRQDLARFGWGLNRSHIISEGIEIQPISSLKNIQKYAQPTMLSFGAMRSMKRTLDQIAAFQLAKRQLPDLQLKIAGDASGEYGKQVLQAIDTSPYRDDITYLGRVSLQQKIQLMRACHIIAVTSIKEGWGLIITEAASQGTPAVVYDADGQRDSVRHGQSGLVTSPNPAALAEGIVELLTNMPLYNKLQRCGWEWSKLITFEQCYHDFKRITEAYA